MSPRKDLTGQVFGKLTVVSPNAVKKYYWDCLCECGNETTVAGSSLISGGTKACGCLQSRFKDLVGKVFGRLTVVNLSHVQHSAYWFCRCECGTEKVIIGTRLTKDGGTRSCGCIQKEAAIVASRKDLTGQVFGKLTVLAYHHTDKIAYWECECSCGKRSIVRGSSLRNGGTQSCGCYLSEASSIRNSTHRLTGHPIHNVWSCMKQRYFDPNSGSYPDYGGRGITVCDEWLDFMPFYEWALANNYKKGLMIERVDNDGDYVPFNCKWATRKEQNNNTRRNIHVVYRGEAWPFNALFNDGDASRYTKVWKRIFERGWDVDRAVDTL